MERRSTRQRKTRRRKKEKLELRVKIENFGPISSGEVKLKPLTLFIGPNNSGKSYTAMLIRSILRTYDSRLLIGMPLPTKTLSKDKNFLHTILAMKLASELKNAFEEISKFLKAQINRLKKEEEIEIPQRITKKISGIICKKLKERLSNEISNSFACPLKELVKTGEKNFVIRAYFNSHRICAKCSENALGLEECPQPEVKIKVGKAKVSVRVGDRVSITEMNKSLWQETIGDEKRSVLATYILNQVSDLYVSEILKIFSTSVSCYYLPAARSGILQGHKLLVASIIEQVPFVGIKRFEIPKFSGIVARFLSSIINLPQEKGSLYRLARTLEKELIEGQIMVSTPKREHYPEIRYLYKDKKIPLPRASSSVSELAPLILYLKYIVEPGDILIIEEPEAHLHPRNQRVLAKFLVRLVRKGVKVIVTTHSEFLVEQLSNFILLSKVKSAQRSKRYKYEKNDFLKPDETAVYIFKYSKKMKGFKTVAVKVTEEGIPQEEFLKIDEALYEETIKLKKEVSKDQE